MRGDKVMFRSRITICAVLLIASAIAGCSGNAAKNNKAKSSKTDVTQIFLNETYLVNIEDQTFYCMRVKDKYYKFVYTGSSAELLSADDPSLLPELEDGKFAKVTADLELHMYDFGYVPNVQTVATKITKLKSSKPVDFEDITKYFNLPSADSKEIKKISKLFRYTHNGKLYLILLYKGQLTAYSKDGLFIEYEPEDKEKPFTEFFDALGKKS